VHDVAHQERGDVDPRPVISSTRSPAVEPMTSAPETPPPSRSSCPPPRPGTAARENSVRLPLELSSVGSSAKEPKTMPPTTRLVNDGSRSSATSSTDQLGIVAPL
jgi:hypothetical protein